MVDEMYVDKKNYKMTYIAPPYSVTWTDASTGSYVGMPVCADSVVYTGEISIISSDCVVFHSGCRMDWNFGWDEPKVEMWEW